MYQDNYPPKPSLQVFLAWVVVLVTMAVFIDWPWMVKGITNNPNAKLIQIGTPEYDHVMQCFEEIQDEVEIAITEKKLTPELAAKLQMDLNCLANSVNGGSETIGKFEVWQYAREEFIKNWQPPAEANPENVKFYTEDKERRRLQADLDFRYLYQTTRDKEFAKKYPNGVLNVHWDRLFLWLVKWYYIFTIPTLLVSLMNMKFKGESVKVELIIGFWRKLFGAIFGPIGLALASDTAAIVVRYRKLERKFIANHGWDALKQLEKEVLWLQAKEPVLKFDQAMIEVKRAGFKASRPAFVCAFAWCIGFTPAIVKTIVEVFSPCKTVAVAAVQVKETKSGNEKQENGGSDQDDNHAAEPTAKFEIEPMPAVEIFTSEQWAMPQPRWLWQTGPRGPPAAVKGQQLAIADKSLDCTTQKRGLS